MSPVGNTMIFERYPTLSYPENNYKVIMKDVGEEFPIGVGFKIEYGTRILNDNWVLRLRKHKRKGKPMWLMAEDNLSIVNVKNSNGVLIHNSEGKHCIMVNNGYGHKTIKSFKYKEDAEKYLGELMDKLNDED